MPSLRKFCLSPSPTRILSQLFNVLLLVVLLSACSSGSGGATVPVAPATIAEVSAPSALFKPSLTSSRVTVNYILPNSLSQAFKRTQGQRHLSYVSASNLSISVVVTPVGGSAMTPVVGSCTTASCVITFTANTGPNMLAFTLTDNASGTGTVLSTFSTMTIVAPVTVTTLNITANPVVKSVTLQLASTTTNAGTVTNDSITVKAFDPDNNLIVGSGNYVDSSGNSLALLLNISDASVGGIGSLSIEGPMRITNAGQSTPYIHYDGNAIGSGTVSVSSTRSIAGTLGTATLAVTPTVSNLYTVPTTAGAPHGITIGPDGNIWFAEFGANKIGRMTTGGVFTEFTIPTSASGPYAPIVGPDGAIWFAEYNTNKIGRCTLTGTITEQTIPTATSKPEFLAVGPDGDIWFTESNVNQIGRFLPTNPSSIVEYTVPTAGSSPRAIILGPDGNIWISEFANAANKIAKISTSGVFTEYTVPTANADPNFMTIGPDGNIWITENTGNKIAKMTTSGIFTEYTIPTSNAQPYAIVTGTDGNLWFAEKGSTTIASISTSGSITEYSGASGPYGIVPDGNGNLWFSEQTANIIGEFVI